MLIKNFLTIDSVLSSEGVGKHILPLMYDTGTPNIRGLHNLREVAEK